MISKSFCDTNNDKVMNLGMGIEYMKLVTQVQFDTRMMPMYFYVDFIDLLLIQLMRCTIGRAFDMEFTGRGFESWLGTTVYWPRVMTVYLHPCASVTKQYNLVLVKGQ